MEEPRFFGTVYHSLDEHGRIIIPSKFRKLLPFGGKVYLCWGSSGKCIHMLTPAGWDDLVRKLDATIPKNDDEGQRFISLLMGSVSDPEIDKQGRIPLTPELRVYAGIATDVATVGVNTRIEIWNADARRQLEQAEDFLDLSRRVSDKYKIF
jgi:MraZ protein